MFAMSLCAGAAIAQDDPDYGFDFVTITDIGNRDTTLEETVGPFGFPGAHIGGVDYEYRIAITEVSVEQYFEFVVAYLPFFIRDHGSVAWPTFFGRYISLHGGHASINPGSALRPTSMGWEFAARYVNWLHNEKINEEWAFETGVYDTSTFTSNPDGTGNHQEAHHPDARYWMPTRDEWVKAGYWDPSKDGEGLGGYWRFPSMSNSEPIPNLLPEDGGERNAGSFVDGWPVSVAFFPEVASPWGLLDMAGGMTEFSETVYEEDMRSYRAWRWSLGSAYVDSSYGQSTSYDILGQGVVINIRSGGVLEGLRLASAIRHPADLNQDWHVNYYDISLFIQRFASGDLSIDYNADGNLDIDDVLIF